MTTFRSFCSSSELLTLLVERFAIPTPHSFIALDPQHLLSSITTTAQQQSESSSFPNGALQQQLLFSHNMSQAQLEQAFHKFRQDYQKPIQLKVLSIINHWVSNHFYDFESDPPLLVRLMDFLIGNDRSIKLITSHKKWCTKIQEVIKRKHRHQQPSQQQLDVGHSADGEVEGNKFNSSTSTTMSAPIGSDSGVGCSTTATAFNAQYPEPVWHYAKEGDTDAYDLLTLHPLEIARQVTLLQFFLYRAIKPFELVDAAWTKRDKYQRSPQLLKLIDHSNNLTYWVARSIVETESVEERVEMLSRVLEIMTVFEELNNFNGIVAFFAALNCQPVYRLDESKARLDKEKRGWYDHYVQLCGNGHLTELLHKLRSINPPCVPFAGTYLTQIVLRLESLKQMEGRMNQPQQQQMTAKSNDLSMPNSEQVSEQNIDSVSTTTTAEKSPLATPKGKADPDGVARKMISFMKCRKIAAIIREIQMYQNQPYSLRVEPTIRVVDDRSLLSRMVWRFPNEMVAMFSLFCGATEPIFSSCMPPHNGGYDYLLFDVKEDGDSSSLTAPTTISAVDLFPNASGNSAVNASSEKMPPEALSSLPRKKELENWHRKWSTSSSQCSQLFHAKAASEPPPECYTISTKIIAKKHFSSFRDHNLVAKQHNLHFSSIAGKERKIRQKLATNNDTNGRISRFMHFLESLNPLNGFKDKDELENYLYNQSHKIEPKNGEIPNSKPKHPPEALKSPGVKQQKTPISGGCGGGTFHRFPISKSSGKSSASSPHSPCHAVGSSGGGGGALLSPSHINVPTRSPASAGSVSGSSVSMPLTDDPNFAIVDISPGHFPRWLGDTCGRINPAFISEYASTTAASAATFHPHHQMPSGGSPTSPGASMLQQRRRPPAPLSAGESHFTFPPAQQQHHQQQSQQQRFQQVEQFRKPPASLPHQTMATFPLEEQQQQQQRVVQPPHTLLPPVPPSSSTALPAFPLAKPPLARKKLPAVDPPYCSSPTTVGSVEQLHSAFAESCFTLAETPPQLPPRTHPPLTRQQTPYQQSPLSNFMMGAGGGGCSAFPEAMAPPRPPKKGICNSPTTHHQLTMQQQQQRQSLHQSPSPVTESPPPPLLTDAIAPPIPPKPLKSATPK
uniref:Son of sevenless n=1 Tax=Globodera rostochiensis TaxID=31243 RepID=A0A914GRE9_GLORO